MSKPNSTSASTIAAKPKIDPAVQWIGGSTTPNAVAQDAITPNTSSDSNTAITPTSEIGNLADPKKSQADKLTSQQAGKTTSQPKAAKPKKSEAMMPEMEITAMLSVRLRKSLIQRLRVRAATEDRHIQDIVADLISDYLDEE